MTLSLRFSSMVKAVRSQSQLAPSLRNCFRMIPPCSCRPFPGIFQDILVRRARMEGKNACWVPGTDHASIATEAKVVNKLAAQGIKKTDLTREEFLKHAWEWTDEHGGIILKQLRKLGASPATGTARLSPWTRKRSESVIKVFCRPVQQRIDLPWCPYGELGPESADCPF